MARNAAQDVTWIEQLAQKRNDLNASRAVAVSPNGFSKDARAKAEHEGIELREFSELSQEEVQSWCKVGEISCFTRRALLSHISVELDSKTVDDSVAVPDDLKQRLAKLDLGDKLFIAKGRGELQSVQTIWRNLVGTEPVFDGAPQDGRHVPRRFKIQYPNESDRFLLEPMPARPEVAAIVVEAELWLERTQVPISRIHQYVSDDGAHVETVEYYVEAKNARRVVSLHRLVESGELAVTVRRLEDPR